MRFPRCCFVLALFAFPASSQGFSAEDAADKMTALPGFRVELVAAEPMITQPVALNFDDRGRLWVVQYLQYPNPEGLTRVEVDRYSRTIYDRVPEPPPHGPKGADAITILEDTTGDGRMDTSRNFVEGLNLCSGLAFGHGGVFVLQVPYLLFYPDRNRDDVPDSEPEVLLTGFGMEDTHSVANNLTWGPDGWLYGNQGSTVTARIRGIEFQQGVWRYHPVTRDFELFAEGGGNMWGLDFDAAGHLFASTNVGPYVLLHAMQGAYYWKAFGKHGALHNPHAYGYFDHAAHANPQGGHVTVGGQVYQGHTYPREFWGTFIGANLLSHNVYYHEMLPAGSTFATRHLGELMHSNDTWFAPSAMTTGPDGCLYIADWHDRRTAHPDPDADWDRSNGRVYRIAYAAMKPLSPFDLQDYTSERLVAELHHPNAWFRRRVRVALAERRDPAVLPRLRDQAMSADTPQLALESLWALYVSGGFEDFLAEHLLQRGDADVRRWTVRLLGDAREVSAPLAERLVALAQSEEEVQVRAQLAASARRLPSQEALQIVSALALRDEDHTDPHQPLLLWWVVEAHAMAAIDATLAHLLSPEMWGHAIPRETLLPRLIRRYAAEGSAAGDHAAVRMLDTSVDSGKRDLLLAGLEQGLQDRGTARPEVALGNLFERVALAPVEGAREASAAPLDETLIRVINRLYEENRDTPLLLRLAVRAGNESAYTRAMERAGDAALGVDGRVAMLEILGRFGREEAAPLLVHTIEHGSEPAVRQAALRALRNLPLPALGIELLGIYERSDPDARQALRDVLFSKAHWARAFLDAVDAGAVDAEEVPLEQLRSIANHDDPELNALVEKHWGIIRAGTPEEKLAEMRRLNNELNFAPGDAARGKQIFAENCVKCHELYGEGGTVGPGLTQSNRFDREYLLVSLVDPSLMVRKEYQQYIVETRDGGLYNGVLAESVPGFVTLLNANAEPETIPADQIEEMREHPLSLMPEGLLSALPGDAIRDLFAYLQQAAE